MSRLNDRAFNILSAEVETCATSDTLGQAEKEIAIARLKELRKQKGTPATETELRDTVIDVFPHFSEKALKAAAKANRPPGVFAKIQWTAALLLGAAGVVYVVNLPYPMIRRPVARTAPLLLLPSYVSMDRNYRQAIASVEQADRLVNSATSAADLELGERKVKQAQAHLDALPVWFLDYYPQRYCTLFGCTWQFTLDEFEAARKQIGRMEARVFQEKNAQTLLIQGEDKVNQAKQEYERVRTAAEKQKAIAAWQAGMDLLNQIPPQTLAGQMSKTKLAAYQRDFRQVSTLAVASQRNYSLIEAAKQFGWTAASASQNPPHSAAQWQEVANLWQQAIQRLQQVPLGDPAYLDAQQRLAQYQQNLGVARTRQQAEKESAIALQRAKDLISQWQSLAASNPNRGLLASQLQSIVNQLDKVRSGTTSTDEARQLLTFARAKLQELQ